MEQLDLTEAERVVDGWSRETNSALSPNSVAIGSGEIALGYIISTYANGKFEVESRVELLHDNHKLTIGAVNGLTTKPTRIAVPDGHSVLIYAVEGSTTVGDCYYTLAADLKVRLSLRVKRPL